MSLLTGWEGREENMFSRSITDPQSYKKLQKQSIYFFGSLTEGIANRVSIP